VAQRKTSSKSGGSGRTSTKSLKKSTSRRAKSAPAAPQAVTEVAEDEVSIDRRRTDRRADELDGGTTSATPLQRRQKVNRRRQIDPTTCERDYTDQEVEFMNALDDYKRKSGRMFPTCSEVLEVLRGLGYVKLSASEMGALAVDSSTGASAKPMPSEWSATAVEQVESISFDCDSELV
jgi:hypothetical protein